MKSIVLNNFQLLVRSDVRSFLYHIPPQNLLLVIEVRFLCHFNLLILESFSISLVKLLLLKVLYVCVSLVTSVPPLLHISSLLSYHLTSLSFSGRNNIFPTLFLLWRCPHAVRTFVIHAPVSGQNHSYKLLCYAKSVIMIHFHYSYDLLWNNLEVYLSLWFQCVDRTL